MKVGTEMRLQVWLGAGVSLAFGDPPMNPLLSAVYEKRRAVGQRTMMSVID
ncbi:MAG: hypothetical protein ABEI52_00785 [Halobacteriaceae archaeon]